MNNITIPNAGFTGNIKSGIYINDSEVKMFDSKRTHVNYTF